jgi:protein TonB
MENKLFSSVMVEKQKTKKWLLIPISTLFHALIAGALIVIPLMDATTQMPELKITTVTLTMPPLATPPTGKPAGKGKGRRLRREKKAPAAVKPKPVPVSQFVAPMVVSETIEEEELPDFGGDPNGVVGGFDEGIVGGSWEGVLGGMGEAADAPVLRVSQVKAPKLIRRVEPQYPKPALMARIRGTVIIEAVTDIYGNVKTTKVISGHPLLKGAAVAAVRQWIYEPYIVNGVPKPVVFTVTVTFNLR